MSTATHNTSQEANFKLKAEKSAQEFIQYRNEVVIDRFSKVHHVTLQEAEEIFQELMKFLYVCAYIPASSPPSAVVDEMWHTFIIFTADYFKFCVDYVGRFLHHQPTDKPYIGNRPDMLDFAERSFGRIDDKYWYHITKTLPGTLRTCGKNWCSENCMADRDLTIGDIKKMGYYMAPINGISA